MHDYLKEILHHKQIEVNQLKKRLADHPDNLIAEIYYRKKNIVPKKSLMLALQKKQKAVIAEVKRKSPSKGYLATIPNPEILATQYADAGAAAISVLTDPYGFNGSINDLKKVSQALEKTDCAILRKDFMIDTIQISEAIAAGADAILLIVCVLQEKTLALLTEAKQLGIDALVEVHNQQELEYAIKIGAEIIGINNRNLTTFSVDLTCAKKLFPLIPDHIISVAESGIHTSKKAKYFYKQGFNALLIGEALVKSKDPAQFIEKISA